MNAVDPSPTALRRSPFKEAIVSLAPFSLICVYAANKKTQDSFMDVLVRLFKGNVEIEFRSLGVAIDPMVDVEEDLQVNLRVLRSVAKSIETEYVLGMNSVRLVIDTREENRR